MGLGARIHAAVGSPYVFERDSAKGKFGIEFRRKPKKWRRWPPLPTPLDNPIGIDGVLESLTPHVPSMRPWTRSSRKARPGRHLQRQHHLRPLQGAVEYGDAFLKMANKRPTAQVVEYTKEICNYIWDTYGRFPAHVNAFHRMAGRPGALTRRWSSTTNTSTLTCIIGRRNTTRDVGRPLRA